MEAIVYIFYRQIEAIVYYFHAWSMSNNNNNNKNNEFICMAITESYSIAKRGILRIQLFTEVEVNSGKYPSLSPTLR